MTDNTSTYDGPISTMQHLETSAQAAALETMGLQNTFHAATVPSCSTKAATSGESVKSLPATKRRATADTTSLFARLPGELRNRIYRAYFKNFQDERYELERETLKNMAPDPLALLQTNRMLRSEASWIFYEEFAPFEQIPFAHQRETPDVVVNRIHALCTLLAMRDVNVRITVLCLMDREGCMSDNECWEAGFSARMIPEFIAEETGEVIVPKSFNDRSTEEEGGGEDLDCSICGIDDFYEARIGDDFLIKHRSHGSPKPPEDGCFFVYRGPVGAAELETVLCSLGCW